MITIGSSESDDIVVLENKIVPEQPRLRSQSRRKAQEDRVFRVPNIKLNQRDRSESCSVEPAEQPAKRKRGRPRKNAVADEPSPAKKVAVGKQSPKKKAAVADKQSPKSKAAADKASPAKKPAAKKRKGGGRSYGWVRADAVNDDADYFGNFYKYTGPGYVTFDTIQQPRLGGDGKPVGRKLNKRLRDSKNARLSVDENGKSVVTSVDREAELERENASNKNKAAEVSPPEMAKPIVQRGFNSFASEIARKEEGYRAAMKGKNMWVLAGEPLAIFEEARKELEAWSLRTAEMSERENERFYKLYEYYLLLHSYQTRILDFYSNREAAKEVDAIGQSTRFYRLILDMTRRAEQLRSFAKLFRYRDLALLDDVSLDPRARAIWFVTTEIDSICELAGRALEVAERLAALLRSSGIVTDPVDEDDFSADANCLAVDAFVGTVSNLTDTNRVTDTLMRSLVGVGFMKPIDALHKEDFPVSLSDYDSFNEVFSSLRTHEVSTYKHRVKLAYNSARNLIDELSHIDKPGVWCGEEMSDCADLPSDTGYCSTCGDLDSADVGFIECYPERYGPMDSSCSPLTTSSESVSERAESLHESSSSVSESQEDASVSEADSMHDSVADGGEPSVEKSLKRPRLIDSAKASNEDSSASKQEPHGPYVDCSAQSVYTIHFSGGNCTKEWHLREEDESAVLFDSLFGPGSDRKLFLDGFKLSRHMTIGDNLFVPGDNYITLDENDHEPLSMGPQIRAQYGPDPSDNVMLPFDKASTIADLIEGVKNKTGKTDASYAVLCNGRLLSPEDSTADTLGNGYVVDVVDASSTKLAPFSE
ncbi:hypothetical protein PAPHI01_2500, partial [Pancytospora philotis]